MNGTVGNNIPVEIGDVSVPEKIEKRKMKKKVRNYADAVMKHER